MAPPSDASASTGVPPPAPVPQPAPAAAGRLVGSGGTSREAAAGFLCGMLFGLTSPLIGHPLDTVKTKMQAQGAYVQGGAWRTLRAVARSEGFLALYRGLLPPLLGSSVFRSVQFSVYSAAYSAAAAHPALRAEVPGTGGLQVRVLTSGLLASFARALIETPLEFVKVRRQTGQAWRLAPTVEASLRQPVAEVAHLFQGFGVSFIRTWGLMGSFFVMVDTLERRHPEALAIPLLGPFMKGGVCATAAWVLVWPFENLKNQIQANTAGVPAGAGVAARARFVLAHRGGVAGLYRGIGPGLARSLIANGSSMVVFSYCQACFREME
jgi:solute carrier family 25 carnitine/acylcarnitine transporter 20/29